MSTHKKTEKPGAPDGSPDQHAVAARAVAPYQPAFDEIRLRAYDSYIQRGRIDGFDLEDWLKAEMDMKENGNKRSA